MTIEAIKNEFVRYGFLQSPLADDEIKLLKAQRFTDETIYNIGCDMAAAQFDTIGEAIASYKED